MFKRHIALLSENMDFKMIAVHQEYHSEIGTALIRNLLLSINLSGRMARDPVEHHTSKSPLEQNGHSFDQMANLLPFFLPSVAGQGTAKLAKLL